MDVSGDVPRCLRLRQELGESQEAFAQRIGQSQGTIYRLEKGQPETGPQKMLLDIIEREIAAGRIAVQSLSIPSTTEASDAA
jgi:transcriptional regulator with XRE-family HTH domain